MTISRSRLRRALFVVAVASTVVILVLWVVSNIWMVSYHGTNGWGVAVVRGQLSVSSASFPGDGLYIEKLPSFDPRWRPVRYFEDSQVGLRMVFVALWIPALMASVVLGTLVAGMKSREKGRCAKCGYVLAGLASAGDCPECGTKYEEADLATRR